MLLVRDSAMLASEHLDRNKRRLFALRCGFYAAGIQGFSGAHPLGKG